MFFRGLAQGGATQGASVAVLFVVAILSGALAPKHMPPLWGTRAYPSFSPHPPLTVG